MSNFKYGASCTEVMYKKLEHPTDNLKDTRLFICRSECESEVKGFPGARYKKFATESEATSFITAAGSIGSSAVEHSLQSTSVPQPSCLASSAVKRILSNDENPTGNKKFKKDQFQTTSNSSSGDCNSDSLSVYTDGCCHDNGRGNPRAGLGVYWGRPDHPDNLSERLSGRQTNNRAEIYAAIRAIQQAKMKQCKHLTIYTDSAFLINCHTKWMSGWKKNGWKNSTGKAIINREELEELDEAQEGIQVSYVHVRGHQGIEGNEHADRLANEGARKEY